MSLSIWKKLDVIRIPFDRSLIFWMIESVCIVFLSAFDVSPRDGSKTTTIMNAFRQSACCCCLQKILNRRHPASNNLCLSAICTTTFCKIIPIFPYSELFFLPWCSYFSLKYIFIFFLFHFVTSYSADKGCLIDAGMWQTRGLWLFSNLPF